MRDEWTDRLSEYLDGELSDDERYAVESHLAGCRECAAALAELKEVVERARTAGPRPPHADLWPGIAERLGPPSRSRANAPEPRRFSFTLPQLAAAAVLLIAVSSGVAWRLHPSRSPGASDTPGTLGTLDRTLSADPSADQIRAVPVSLADAQYDAAVVDLERALAKGRGRLDKATIAIVEENLRIIDQAINQAREALTADPANNYLSSHLVEARRKKLDLLRRATALTDTN
jgi:anti-sigma factor RsiW